MLVCGVGYMDTGYGEEDGIRDYFMVIVEAGESMPHVEDMWGVLNVSMSNSNMMDIMLGTSMYYNYSSKLMCYVLRSRIRQKRLNNHAKD